MFPLMHLEAIKSIMATHQTLWGGTKTRQQPLLIKTSQLVHSLVNRFKHDLGSQPLNRVSILPLQWYYDPSVIFRWDSFLAGMLLKLAYYFMPGAKCRFSDIHIIQ